MNKKISLVFLGLFLFVSLSVFAGGNKEAENDDFKSVMTEFSDKNYDISDEEFYEKIVPIAKNEEKLVFFDFSGSLGPIFTDTIIPSYEKKYGIKVEYYKVKSVQGAQQVISATKADKTSPVDVFFMGSGSSLNTVDSSKALWYVPLNKILPNGKAIRKDIAAVINGIEHGGAYLPFHMNQTSLVYDSRKVNIKDLPVNFNDFLEFAKKNSGKVAVTTPSKGGSGEGFAWAACVAMLDKKSVDEMYDFSKKKEDADLFIKSGVLKPVVQYYRELKNHVIFTNGNADTLNLIANSEVIIGSAWEDMVFTWVEQGILPKHVRQTMINGQVGGADGMFIPKTSAKKASAMLFIDEAVSAAMLTEKVKIIGSRPPRTDIDFVKEVPEDKLVYLIPPSDYDGKTIMWGNKIYAKAIKEYLTETVLGQ